MKNSNLLCLLLLVVSTQVNAQEPTTTQTKFFEAKIRPALVKYCYECHSADAGESRAGLLVDTKLGLLQGGDGGPAIVPGDLDESPFWEAINWEGYEMPPSKKMPDSVIADFKTWIEMGAPDPRVRKKVEFKTKISKSDIKKVIGEHWAFQKPMPESSESIDDIINARLADKELTPAKPADPFTLLRRINYDLVGLPPTPAEIKAFHKACQSNKGAAIKSKVDELLARPQYGERWGRHWMDVARYSDSSGSRNNSYPHAWRYRDYVIDSFNENKPYDRFVAEQVAGDLLPAKTDEQWQENLIATGFLAIGLKHHDQKNPRQFESDMVDEQIDTMTQAVLGLTVACARCHDHKYDPIPTADYYALVGVMRSTKTLFGLTRAAQTHRTTDLLLLPVADKTLANSQARGETLATLKKRIADLDQQMITARGRPKDGGPNKDLKALRNSRNRLAAQLATFNPNGTKKTFGMGVQDADEMVNANVLIGGELERPAQEVDRGFLQMLGDLNFTEKSQKKSGRLKLADSMTSKDNPLTARVMVNRIWMHLLGKPLVDTPNNFGLSGNKPQQQELLDSLAIQFMEEGWNVKSMIRKIMASDAYQRSSKYNEANFLADPENKLLWRGNPRQLDAEAMRDSMLAFAGELDLDRPYGSGVSDGKPRATPDASARYRSVYLPIVRDDVVESLSLFDFADPNTSSAARNESIVPTQALYMMNGEFVNRQANSMAASLEKEFQTTNERVRNAFLWVYGRPATDEEIQASVQFFKEFKPGKPPAAPVSKPSVSQQPDDPAGVAFYESKIRPILSENCYKCHSGRRVKGGLAIDTKAGLLQGGESGAAVKPGDKDASLLLNAILYKDSDIQMPPSGKLSNSEISNITKWIKMGAPMSSPSSANAGNSQSSRRGKRGMAGGKNQRGQRGGRGQGGQNQQASASPSTDNKTLAVFCQTLMASARFRILN